MTSGQPYSHTVRVRYAEVDMQRVVFNPHYLAYFDANITELWRVAFGGYQTMLDRGVDMVLAEARLRFAAAAHFDDELTLTVAVSHMGNTSLITEHGAQRDGETLVEGTLRHVLVDRDSMRKTPIPDWLRAGLAPWLLTAVSDAASSDAGADAATPRT